MYKLLTMILTLIILYSIIQHKFADNDSVAPSEAQVLKDSKLIHGSESVNILDTQSQNDDSFIDRLLYKLFLKISQTENGKQWIENIFRPIKDINISEAYTFTINNPEMVNAMFQITDLTDQVAPQNTTSADVALCGEIVDIDYKLMDMDYNIIHEKSVITMVGDAKNVLGLNAIIPGMKIGQTRHALISDKYFNTQKSQNKNSRLVVTLKNISKKSIYKKDYKIFDDEIGYKVPLLCGNNVVFDAKITDLANGATIYDSEQSKTPIKMRVGDSAYPMIFSPALHGKVPIGTRTVIAKADSFKSFDAKNSIFHNVKFNQTSRSGYFMLEIKNFN